MPFAGFLLGAVLFYFLVRGVAKDTELSVYWCAAWLIGAALVGMGGEFVAGIGALHLPTPAPEIIHVVLSLGTLTVILWHQGYQMRQVWIIMGLYTLFRAGMLALLLMAKFD